MSATPTPRSVKAIGWSCVAFGAFLLWAAGLSLLVWLLLPQALDPAVSALGSELPLMRWIRAHWTAYALAQGVLGIAHVAVGVGFVKLREWGRVSLESICWLFLAGTFVSTWMWGVGPSLAGGDSREPPSILWTVAGWLFVVAQVVGLALLLSFLRRKATRAVFAGARLRAPTDRGM